MSWHDTNMSNIKKLQKKKTAAQNGMRVKYWRQVFSLAERQAWDELCTLVEKNRWLATAAISPSLLPDYLAEDKDYDLLRLVANVDDIPVEVIRKITSIGAKDPAGRSYLVRLLVGEERKESDQAKADSPLVAAELLKTAVHPTKIIVQMQRTLEQGVTDTNAERRALAERSLDRSQLFYDLVLVLQEESAEDRLAECLASEELLLQFQEPEARDWRTVTAVLDGGGS